MEDDLIAPLTAAECDSLAAEYRARADAEVDSVMRKSLAHLAEAFAILGRSKERAELALRGR